MTTTGHMLGTYANWPGTHDVCFISDPLGAMEQIPLRLDICNYSPDGFNWGYHGSGPSQLALAILAHATGDDEVAKRYHQRFKVSHVATQDPHEDFSLSITTIADWLTARGWALAVSKPTSNYQQRAVTSDGEFAFTINDGVLSVYTKSDHWGWQSHTVVSADSLRNAMRAVGILPANVIGIPMQIPTNPPDMMDSYPGIYDRGE